MARESKESASTRCVVIIPARLESQRLPRKMLLSESGKPLIQHTYEAATAASLPEAVYVATDSDEIRSAVEGFGGRCIMTSKVLKSGTDRVEEAARRLDNFDLVINVQGDEPEIGPEAIDGLCRELADDRSLQMATVVAPLRSWSDLDAATCVKVVCDASGNAVYFSRAPIPFPRERSEIDLDADPPLFLRHMGVYGYRRAFLRQFVNLGGSRYELCESLEQLRVIEAGHRIRTVLVQCAKPGIDTRDDYNGFLERLAAKESSKSA